MIRALIVILVQLAGAGCVSSTRVGPVPQHLHPARVLILGDSISMGYTPKVREQLGATAVVIRPTLDSGKAENCSGTTKGLGHVDRWIAIDGGPWDIIHFNFGLHDIKHVIPRSGKTFSRPDDPRQAPLATYVANLTAIATTLKATGATVIFATTTPVPHGDVRPFRNPADVVAYNAAAIEVMNALEIPINDLYAFCIPKLDEIQRPANVHFTSEGSQILGDEVARVISALALQRAR
jgi:acyl-CoA thioesterase-1